MLRRLFFAAVILAIFAARFAWRHHEQNRLAVDAQLEQIAPALNRMAPALLVNSDWSYSGPLGPLTLRFESDGRLLVTSHPDAAPGHWEIEQTMLSAYIPGADKPHQGMFRSSTDEIVGIGPPELQLREWKATRVRDGTP